jgi:hypothetical protein
VRRIQLHRIRKEVQITNVNEKMSIVEDSYAKTFDDLSLNELNDDEDFQSTLHRIEIAASLVKHSQKSILIRIVENKMKRVC